MKPILLFILLMGGGYWFYHTYLSPTIEGHWVMDEAAMSVLLDSHRLETPQRARANVLLSRLAPELQINSRTMTMLTDRERFEQPYHVLGKSGQCTTVSIAGIDHSLDYCINGEQLRVSTIKDGVIEIYKHAP